MDCRVKPGNGTTIGQRYPQTLQHESPEGAPHQFAFEPSANKGRPIHAHPSQPSPLNEGREGGESRRIDQSGARHLRRLPPEGSDEIFYDDD